MVSQPDSSAAHSAVASLLRTCLALLLYLFILWCSWRLYRLGQYLNRRAGDLKGAAPPGECGEAQGRELLRRHDDDSPAEGEEHTSEVVVEAGVSYGTPDSLPQSPSRKRGGPRDGGSGVRGCWGKLWRGARRLCCCCRASTAMDDRTPKAAPWLPQTRRSRLCCTLPAIPPVLFLLLTGVIAREVFEYLDYRQSLHELKQNARLYTGMGKGGKGFTLRNKSDSLSPADVVAAVFEPWALSVQSHVSIVERLLSVSKPFLLFGLATIGLDIGSHLTYPQLTLVRKQLCLFLLCLFPLVFAGMTLVFRFAGAYLLKSTERAEWLMKALSVVHNDGDAAAIRGGAVAGVSSTAGVGQQQHPQRRGVAFAASTPSLLSSAATVDDVMNTFAEYESATLWCFALVMACIAVERSSPEFITAIQMTGARGILPTFVLCVTACQDMVALVLFVIVSSMIRPIEVNGASVLLSKMGHLVVSAWEKKAKAHGGNGSTGNSGAGGTAAGLSAAGAVGDVAAASSSLEEGEQSAARELTLIAVSTLGAVAVSLMLRQGWLWALRRIESRLSRNKNMGDVGEDGDAGGSVPVPLAQARPVVYASFGLLAVLTVNLSLWSVLTPCELLLAAVFTGSGASFFVPCPLLHLSVGAMNEVTNVVLFTTMGMRTRFSSYALPTLAELMAEGQAKKKDGGAFSPVSFKAPPPVEPPSLVVVMAWGVLFFVARVALLWLGGFVGATVGSVERLVNRFTTPPSGRETPVPAPVGGADEATQAGPGATTVVLPTTTAMGALKKRDEGKEAATTASTLLPASATTVPVRPITGVRNWIGLALITQLAIALTLNGRGGDEYGKRLATVVSRNYFSGLSAEAVKTLSPLLAALSPSHVVLSMSPLVQAYTITIALAMISGPVLGAWVLRKGLTEAQAKAAQ